MRVLVALAVVVVFGAMLVFDTAALVRLTVFCVSGGCGVPPIWIAAVVGGLTLAALLSLRRPLVGAKITGAKKNGPSRPSRGKTGTRKKPKQTK